MALIEELREAVVDGQAKLAVAKVTEALEEGIEAGTLLREGLIQGMAQVGKLYEEGEIFVPEMLVAARAMTAALSVLKPHLVEEGVVSSGKVAIGTTQGDLHDIGKNLVAMMLQGAGFAVFNLGTGVTPQQFVAAVREHRPQLLGMSALLTTTVPKMKATLEALEAAGLRDQVKVMVGGAPVTQAFADEIGADGYGANAGGAVDTAKALLP